MKTFLITGGYGFVGGYLSEYIKSQSDEVIRTGIEKDSEVVLDVTDIKNCKEVIKRYKPSNIIHLAGFSSVKKSFSNPELCEKINVGGTKNLLASVKDYSNKSKVLIISSSEVYGKPNYLPIDETHPLNGTNPYALSRIKQEEMVMSEFSDLNIVISRSFNHTGPKQSKGFVLPDFASQIADIIKCKILPEIHVGNLEAERDFSDVRDIVRVYYLLSISETKSKIYNICSGKYIKIQDILNKLINISSVKVKIIKDQDKIRPIDIKRYFGTSEKVQKELSWKPRISIDETIKDTLAYWTDLKDK